MWKAQHPEGVREIDALHVPLGVPVRLEMTSQDVIHSFGVPAFRIKQDVLPGRYTATWFEATEPGDYHLFCTEYCGTDHARMTGTISVMPPEAYAAWLAAQPHGEDLAGRGRAAVRQVRLLGLPRGRGARAGAAAGRALRPAGDARRRHDCDRRRGLSARPALCAARRRSSPAIRR